MAAGTGGGGAVQDDWVCTHACVCVCVCVCACVHVCVCACALCACTHCCVTVVSVCACLRMHTCGRGGCGGIRTNLGLVAVTHLNQSGVLLVVNNLHPQNIPICSCRCAHITCHVTQNTSVVYLRCRCVTAGREDYGCTAVRCCARAGHDGELFT